MFVILPAATWGSAPSGSSLPFRLLPPQAPPPRLPEVPPLPSEPRLYLLHFLQQRDDVGPQLLQLLVRLLEFGLGVAALLLHSLGFGVRPALERVTQRLQAQLVLLEILLLQPEDGVRGAGPLEYGE